MTETDIPFDALLNDTFDRVDRKKWSSQHVGQPVGRKVAVESVSEVLKAQMTKPFPTSGPGIDFAMGLFCFGEYFSSIPPSEAELAEALRLSEVDYYADLAVKFLQALSKKHPYPAIDAWENRRYLGKTRSPDKPPGPGRYKNLLRDKLIVEQIRELQNVGFNPTRNEATLDRNSGCDIIVDAMKNSGLAISYAAVAAIWKKAGNFSDMSQIATLYFESISVQPSKMPSE